MKRETDGSTIFDVVIKFLFDVPITLFLSTVILISSLMVVRVNHLSTKLAFTFQYTIKYHFSSFVSRLEANAFDALPYFSTTLSTSCSKYCLVGFLCGRVFIW